MKTHWRFALVCLAMAAVAGTGGLSGCASDMDTQQETVDTGSFGTTVLTLVCKRMAYLDDLQDGDGRVDVRGDRYREICRQGLAAPPDATDELKALQARRARLIEAVDTMWPAPFLDELQTFATSELFLSAYDDGTIVAGVEALRDILRLAAERDQATGALERLALREGYTPDFPGAAHALLAYPGLSDVLQHATGDIAPGGAAHEAMTLLGAGAALELRNASGWSEPDRTLAVALDMLLEEREELGLGTPMLMVARDTRGLAEVAPLLPGVLPPPYADTDGDGLADTDPLGRYLDQDGSPIAAPTPFAHLQNNDGGGEGGALRDRLGRVLDRSTGLPVYRYIDLDRTLLAALLREGADLFDPTPASGPGGLDPAQDLAADQDGAYQATAIDLVRGAGALLGPRQSTSRTYDSGDTLTYEGFDTTRSALLDLLHGALQVLRDPGIHDTLALARELLDTQEAALAQLAEALVEAARIPDDFEDGALTPGSPLWDDLIPVVRRILDEPGLFEDLMVAMEDPRVATLGGYFRDYMTYADQFTYDPETQAVLGSFATPVDRAAPNSGFNRSIMQRVLHLLADSNGVPLCNKAGAVITFNGTAVKTYEQECELLQVDNLAVFYVQSLAYARDDNGDFIYDDDDEDDDLPPVIRRKARLPFVWNDPLMEAAATDRVIELSSGIQGFRNHPTPQALNRTLFLQPRPEFLQNVMDPPLDAHGRRIEDIHAGTLPAWELGELYDAIQPLVQPFADHDAEQLFVDLLVVMHDHWPARDSADHQQDDPAAPGYAWASDVASYEPIIAEILGRGTLLTALVETMPGIRAVEVEGRPAPAILQAAAQYVLAPQDGLAKRSGDTSTTTADGRPVPVLSIWHLLADAYALKEERFAEVPDRADAWDHGIARAVDVLARGGRNADGAWRFRNPRLRATGLAVIDALSERLRVHDQAGDRDAWLAQELPDQLEDLLAGPMVAGASDVLEVMSQNPAGRRAIEGMVSYALDEARDPEAFRALVTVAADLLQLALRDEPDLEPLAKLASEVLDPARGWLDPLLAMAHASGRADSNGALAQTLRNLVAPYQPGHTPLGDLADGIGEVFRVRPFADLDRSFDSADYAAMFEGLAAFLDEEKRGLRKFIAIIQGRRR